ncbi:hypothetical protein BH09PSE5_BH09PSE5_44730 [soil metagenome]
MLLTVLTLPFLAYVGASYHRQASTDREDAGLRLHAAAEVTAARLDDHVGDIEQLLKVLSHVVGATIEDTASNDALLRSLSASLPLHINDLSVWDAEGRNVGSLNSAMHMKGIRIDDRATFKAAMSHSGIAVDAPIKSPMNGENIGVFVVGVQKDGKTVGVVSASTRLDRLKDLLAPNSSMPDGAVISVSDSRGKLLARSVDPGRWIGTDVSRQGYFMTALEQRVGTAEGPGVDGVMRIAGFTISQRVPWMVYVAASSSTVLADLRSRTQRDLMVGFVLLVLGALAALWMGNRIARPLRQLSNDAALIGSGELSHRSQVTAGGETGQLAETLNQMAAALQDRNALLERSQEQLRQITDNVPALVSYLDTDQRFVFANRTYRDWLNLDPQELIGQSLADVYGEATYAQFRHHIDAALKGERVVYERDLATSIGAKYVQVTVVPHFATDGSVQGLHVLIHDITQRKVNEERLRHLAEFDLLTGLPNRGLFLDRLKQGMAQAERNQRPMALLLLDIDYFKQVNDTLGHAAGDDLLRAFARRLLDSVRPTDTVARLSGDEFAIILLDLEGMEAAARLADKVVQAVRVPMTVRETELKVSTSVGVALCRPGESEGPALMARADAALYEAKKAGRDRYACEQAPSGAA